MVVLPLPNDLRLRPGTGLDSEFVGASTMVPLGRSLRMPLAKYLPRYPYCRCVSSGFDLRTDAWKGGGFLYPPVTAAPDRLCTLE